MMGCGWAEVRMGRSVDGRKYDKILHNQKVLLRLLDHSHQQVNPLLCEESSSWTSQSVLSSSLKSCGGYMSTGV